MVYVYIYIYIYIYTPWHYDCHKGYITMAMLDPKKIGTIVFSFKIEFKEKQLFWTLFMGRVQLLQGYRATKSRQHTFYH